MHKIPSQLWTPFLFSPNEWGAIFSLGLMEKLYSDLYHHEARTITVPKPVNLSETIDRVCIILGSPGFVHLIHYIDALGTVRKAYLECAIVLGNNWQLSDKGDHVLWMTSTVKLNLWQKLELPRKCWELPAAPSYYIEILVTMSGVDRIQNDLSSWRSLPQITHCGVSAVVLFIVMEGNADGTLAHGKVFQAFGEVSCMQWVLSSACDIDPPDVDLNIRKILKDLRSRKIALTEQAHAFPGHDVAPNT